VRRLFVVNAMEITRTGAVGDIVTEDEMRAQYARMSRLAREGQQVPDLSPAEIEEELAQRRKGRDVSVVEFLELADGRRITSDCGLGYSAWPLWSVGVAAGEEPPELRHPWSVTTLDDLQTDIRFVIEADADDVLEHAEFDEDLTGHAAATAVGLGDEWLRVRWARLLDAAAAEGVTLTPEMLEAAPFEVELTDRLLAERQRHMP
jgi:hypothetical protein